MKKVIIYLCAFFVGINFVFALTPPMSIFTDVLQYELFSDAIQYVKDEGIVNGYSDGSFKPDNYITRGEFSKILANATTDQSTIQNCLDTHYFKSSNGSINIYFNVFTDVITGERRNGELENGNPFVEYICALKRRYVISGYSDDTFKPDNPITIGEASKIIVNSFNLLNGKSVETSSDNQFFGYLVELTERNALPPTMYYEGDYLKREEMAEIIYRLKQNITDKPSTDVTNLQIPFSLEIEGTCGTYQYNPNIPECKIKDNVSNKVVKVLDGCEEGVKCGNDLIYLGLKTNGGQYYLSDFTDAGMYSLEIYFYNFFDNTVEKIADNEDPYDTEAYEALKYKYTQSLF